MRWKVIVAGGGGLGCVVDPKAHFGLGGVDTISALKIRWPDGTETTTT